MAGSLIMKHPTLLCVDDDPRFREFYQVLLASHGYDVIVAGGGRQALKLFHSKEKDIDAVISDYEMPGMNGAELAAELKRCKPELPVIMMSGRQPVLEKATSFVDAAVPKGAPVERIMDQIQVLLAAQRARRSSLRLSRNVPLGSVLAGVVATAAFLLAKISR